MRGQSSTISLEAIIICTHMDLILSFACCFGSRFIIIPHGISKLDYLASVTQFRYLTIVMQLGISTSFILQANNKLEKKEQNFEKLLEEHKTKIESLEVSTNDRILVDT